VPNEQDKKLEERESVIRKIRRFASQQNGLSHRDNFGGWLLIVQRVVSLAQHGGVLP
jgi:hypothetical protein